MKLVYNTTLLLLTSALVFSVVFTVFAFVDISNSYLHWNFWLVSQFRFQYFLIQSVGIIVIGLLFIRKCIVVKLAVFSLISLLIAWGANAYFIFPYYVSSRSHASEGKTVKLMLSNIGSTQDFQPLLRYIKSTNPDILCFVEHRGELDELLRKDIHKKLYPYQSSATDAHLGVYSKLPITAFHVERSQQLLSPSLHTAISVAPFSFLLVVAHPAVALTPQMLEQQEAQYRFWEKRFYHYPKPLIIAADMNSVSWTPAFQALLTRTGLKDSQSGFGIQASWPESPSLFQVPIDHVLFSQEFQVLKREIGPNIGSDHRPVVVTFRVDKN